MKKLFSFVVTVILAGALLVACVPPIPDAIKMEDYFEDTVYYAEYTIDENEEQGWKGSTLKSKQLSLFIDSDESNIPLANYSRFDLNPKAKITELKINSISFVLMCERACDMVFSITVALDEIFEQTVTFRTANAKQVVTLTYPEPYIYTGTKVSGGLILMLKNKLEVGDSKYFIDTVLINADKK